jgi:murein DD-endopeptidase MepM/ murein hydrolase activator NlpD
MLTDEDNKPKTNKENNPVQDRIDREFAGIVDNYGNTTEHPLGDTETIGAKEQSQERRSPKKDKDSPEGEWLTNVGSQSGSGGKFKAIFQGMSGRKKIASAAGAGGVLAVIFALFFGFMSFFQLVHLDEFVSGVTDGPTKKILNQRAVKHYAIVFDEDGRGYYDRKNKPIYGVITSRYLNTDPAKVVADLRDKGYNIEINKNDGRIYLNGARMEGKLSDRRSELRGILDKEYVNEGWIKRYARTQTFFKSMGIKRVFFENTKEKITNWELEYIKKIRSFGRDDVNIDSDSTKKDVQDADGNTVDSVPGLDTDQIESQANELSEKLKDPKFNPELDTSINPVDTATDAFGELFETGDVNLGKMAASTASGAVRIDAGLQLTCEIKAFLMGIELAAKAYRYRALVQYAAPVLVASHQVKTGEEVSAAQMAGLMAILNREPGIASSGAYQVLSGNGGTSKIKNSDRYSLDFKGGAGGVLSKLNDKADSLMGDVGRETCQKARSVVWTLGSITIGVGAAIFSGGTSVIPNAVFGAIKSAFIGLASNIATPILANMMAGNIINGYESGDKAGDALVAGVAMMSVTQRWNLGGHPTSKKAAIENQQIIAQMEHEEQSKKSIVSKYFSLDSAKSVTSTALMRTAPTLSKPTAYIASLASQPKQIANNIMPRATAAEPTGLVAVNQAFGIQDYDVPEIKDDPIEVERWISENNKMDAYKEWYDKCHNYDNNAAVASGMPINQEDIDTMDDCLKEDEETGYRFANYMLDRAISTGIAFNTKASDCMDPDSDEWDCPYNDGGVENADGDDGDSSDDGAFIQGDYAWPVGIFKKDLGAPNMPCSMESPYCHHDSSPAFDLIHKDESKGEGLSVYAITDGEMNIVKELRADCFSFHIAGKDGYDYYYGHITNPVIKGGSKKVKKGDRVAEIGSQSCGNGTIHLHIDQSKELYHDKSDRTINLIKIMNDLYENLPDEAPATSNSGKWVWPIEGASARDVGFEYGKNGCGASGCGPHKAIDIPRPPGTPVLAAHDGKVVNSLWSGNCGYFYLIKATGTDYWMTYQHLANLPSNKKRGDTVTAGEKIGEVGQFCGSGYHLHFGIELSPNISYYTSDLDKTINPLKVLP